MPTTHDYLEKCDSLAVMGGTFDPVHNGHIAVAEAVLHAFNPRRVLFIPAGTPPHKPDKPITPGEHRYQMLLSAVCQNPAFDVSRMEIDKDKPSYTVNTISELREICPRKAKIYFVIGADMAMEILSWEGAERLFTLCELIALNRPGYDIDMDFIENLRTKHGAVIHLLESPTLDISGTMLREFLAEGRPVGGYMPPLAEDYARQHGLYEGKNEIAEEAHKEARFQEIKTQLESRLSNKRFRHTLGTVIEAEKLAKHYGVDENKARLAALLHDCAKEFSADKKRALCRIWGIPLDEIMASHIDLTHSLLGAESAKHNYHITDEEVLHAIRYHTTGRKGVSMLDKIIMLADYIEPHRDDYENLAEMRRLAYTDINKALLIGMKGTNQDLASRGKCVHPWSKETMDELKGENNAKSAY